MRKLFLSFVLVFISVMSFAAPFGLKMGMTVEEIAGVCEEEPEYIENDCYRIFPQKKHPLFKDYVVFVDDEKGLYCIRAVSDDIKTNDYGTELKNAFTEIKDRISKVYGNARVIDKISPDYILDDDQYWVSALADGARTYGAIWESSGKKELNDDLCCVVIYVNAQSVPRMGWVVLEYDFNNIQDVKDSQDSVF